ncbi:small integral membrane protein 29-like [Cololabis saira]|uniref:small integral membrane protein 29-like n=1 Tax=Cololabis saira TaxID=129043 RepID=UPI002AD224B4|nr:small integral membrane protein 29-like [Cololabis saira]XP_061578449.1 small integral membrane protein 29-like [Cololabis saira]
MDTYLNQTTPHVSPTSNKPGFPALYILILVVLLTLIGCIVAVVLYIRRKSRLDELRHRLIPLYNYDAAEDEKEWGDTDMDEEAELTEPLYKAARLSFTSGYRNSTGNQEG